MPKRVPTQGVIVYRDGKQMRVPLGKAFDFTAEELEQITAVNPKALSKISEVEINDEADRKAKEEADAIAANEAAAKQAAADKAEAEKRAKQEQAAAAEREAAKTAAAKKATSGGKANADSL